MVPIGSTKELGRVMRSVTRDHHQSSTRPRDMHHVKRVAWDRPNPCPNVRIGI